MSSTAKRAVLVAVVICAMAAYFVFDLGRFLSLAALKDSLDGFKAFQGEHPAQTVAIFAAAYLVVVAVNLPGAAVLGLMAGALFGFWLGTAVVSVMSTVGATVACALSRYLFRDFVTRRFERRLAPINEGIRREGAFYLFSLRLIPAVPFFLINIAMGLTSIRLWTFAWVSQVGMLLGTMVFVNAGRELAKVESLAGILSPGLVVSFVLIGIVPLSAKKGMAWWRKKHPGKVEGP